MKENHAVSPRQPVKPFDTKFEQRFIKIFFPLEGSANAALWTVVAAFATALWQGLPLIFPSTQMTLNILWLIWFTFGWLVTIYAGIRYAYFLLRYKWSW